MAAVVSGPGVAVGGVLNSVRDSSHLVHAVMADILIDSERLHWESQKFPEHVHGSALPRQDCRYAFQRVNVPYGQHHGCDAVGHIYIHSECLSLRAQKAVYTRLTAYNTVGDLRKNNDILSGWRTKSQGLDFQLYKVTQGL